MLTIISPEYFPLAHIFLKIKEVAWSDPDTGYGSLATITIPGSKLYLAFEKIQFDAKGYNIGGRYIITQVQKGEFVTVWPEKFSTKKPIFK